MSELSLQIDHLSKSQTARYEDWYVNVVIEKSSEVEQVSILPSVEILRLQFEQWYKLHHVVIQYQVCKVWGYHEKRKQANTVKTLIAAGLTDALALALGIPVTSLLGVSIILVTDGFLDKLCESIDNK